MGSAFGDARQLGEERVDVKHDLRVLIAGDDPLVRAGLNALLSAEPGCEVVGEIGLDPETARAPLSSGPDVILCDLGHDPGGSDERLITLDAFGVPVLALIPDTVNPGTVLAAGARGCLRRNARSDQLAAALAAVAAGLQVTEPPAVDHDVPGERKVEPPAEDLTPREIEVLQFLAEGLPNKAIAVRLRISEHTVKFHVNAIMGKLGAHSRTEAVTRAARLGLIVL